MTSGGKSVTVGKTPFRLGPWAAIAIVAIPVVIVNATSDLIEMQRAGLRVHPAEPFIWEITSALVLVLMAPLVGMATRRWTLAGPRLPVSLLIHAGLTVPFTLVHLGGTLPLRSLAYWAYGRSYDFFGGEIWLPLIYEWRKDVLTYAIFAATYAAFSWLAARQIDPDAAPERIEIRDGGRTFFIAPPDLFYAEAAGNYVNLHTATGVRLVRGTLAAWEKRLTSQGFVRIHRSRIVNRAHIEAIRPTAAGDFEVTLSNGQKLAGSRRFRAGLS